MNPAMPTPPEGMYWVVLPPHRPGSGGLVQLIRPRKRWFHKAAAEAAFRGSTNPDHNASEAIRAAHTALDKYRSKAGPLGNLTGYVDAKGRKH